MLIEQKEDRILVLPKLLKGTNTKKTKRLLPGVNEVDDYLWLECKKQFSIQQKLNAGTLVEIVLPDVKDNSKLKAEAEKIEKEVTAKKIIIVEEKKKARRLKDKDEKADKLEDLKLAEEELEKTEQVIKDKQAEYLNSISNFDSFNHKEKEKLIKNTWDIVLLKKWSEEDNKAEVRNIILNQIDKIKKDTK